MRSYSPGWLAGALAASAALVLAAPVVGQLSVWLRDAASDHYVTVVGGIVAASAVAAIGGALYVIRSRRRERLTWLVAAITVAGSYAYFSQTGIADVDAVERFHLVEYGLIAVLFYKAWRPAGDGLVILMPLLCGFAVGTLEEWLQWFVPARVGEAKDVLLNLVAVGSGVLFALGLNPPKRLTVGILPRSRRPLAFAATLAVLAFAGFFHSVHLGHEIADRDAGVFRSRYSADRLSEVSAERAERWRVMPPLTWSRYSREDQYLTEGIAHVRRRNQRWDEGHLLAARQENLILEKYYQPVLDTPSYISNTGHRWPPAQRAQAEQQGPGFMIYESDALTYPVVTWPAWAYWLVVSSAILLTLRRML
jgi:hypothetical protein